MMAEKACLFGDLETHAKIISAPGPEAAKKLGRKVKDFDQAQWTANRFEIVVRGNAAKFGQNAALGRFLLDTHSNVLVEASPRDRIWGIGLGENHPDASNPTPWRGLNLLGFALMRVRDQLGNNLADMAR
jgi:ribA/ribD-fused uncharacterized protein